jgi:hypothetical protein
MIINNIGSYINTAGCAIGGFGAAVNAPNIALNYNAWVFSETCEGGNSITLYTSAADFSLQTGVYLFVDSELNTAFTGQATSLSYSNQYITINSVNGQINSITPCLNAFGWNSQGCGYNNTNTGYVTGNSANIDIGDFLYQNPDSTNPIFGNVYINGVSIYFETNSQGQVIDVYACPT